MDIVLKKGSWYIYGWLGHGSDKALQFLKENPLICDEIEKVLAEVYVADNFYFHNCLVKAYVSSLWNTRLCLDFSNKFELPTLDGRPGAPNIFRFHSANVKVCLLNSSCGHPFDNSL
ncbi:hypothetical protein MKX01_029469, partial [Papaver californicum]